MGSDSPRNDGESRGAREVVVPLRTYKAVTVFSTLLAIVCVIVGFGVLDAAVSGAGPLVALFDFVGLSVGGDVFALVGGLVGLGFIGLGGATYVFGTRFRTEGMRKAQDDGDEPSNDE